MRKSTFWLPLLVFAAAWMMGFGSAVKPVRAQEQSGPEQTFRARVEALYSSLQVGRGDEAEAYVLPESKEAFRQQQKNPFLGFQIQSIKLAPDRQKATATVEMQVIYPPSPAPVPIPQTTEWRLVQGNWYVVLPKPNPVPMHSASQAAAPKPEELKFKGHRYVFGNIPPGQIKVARFPFTNVTDHPVTIAQVLPGCDCLQAELEKREYKPGESGEIVIRFDPTGFKWRYAQTIVVKTQPGDQTTDLTVNAYIAPVSHSLSKPQDHAKP